MLWAFTFWNLSSEVSCRVAWTEIFLEQDLLAFPLVSFLQKTCLWQTLTLNGFTRNASRVFIPANGQIRLGTPPGVLQFIFVFCRFVVGNYAKSIRSHSDIGKLAVCSLWKSLILLWELKWPNLSFSFTVLNFRYYSTIQLEGHTTHVGEPQFCPRLSTFCEYNDLHVFLSVCEFVQNEMLYANTT